MKTRIILFALIVLTANMAYGQYRDSTAFDITKYNPPQNGKIVFATKNAHPIGISNDPMYIVDSSGNPFYNRRAFANTFVKLYDEYAKECYNDSTKQIVGGGQIRVLLTYPSQVVYEYYDTVYSHRRPELIGFIEYLRAKQ